MKNVQQAHLAASKEQRGPARGEDKSTVAEERVGVLGVPNELLDVILGYAPDLETRFAAAHVDWSPATPAPGPSSLDMLQKFRELHKSAALTATEFARAKELLMAGSRL